MSYLHRPQRVWWRRALFQVHLWGGVILGLYIIIIGITGSILVFKDELAAISYPHLMQSRMDAAHPPSASLPQFAAAVRTAFPKYKLVSAFVPGVYGETFFGYMESSNDAGLYVFGDHDGSIIGSFDPKKSWINWVADLHFRLLAGQTGFIVNGIGAACLVLLCATGLVLWWPGIRSWPRALKVNFTKSWKRINFDLHSAIGFWTLSLLLIWAISGVYFVWPKQFENFVNRFSPVAAAVEPEFTIAPSFSTELADLQAILNRAQQAAPATTLSGFYFPADRKSAVTVYQARRDIRNYSLMDRVYLDPYTGALLGVWHSGVNPTLGSKLVYWLGPLHFGLYWGFTVKLIWATVGFALPVLTVTGALMYWNRSLGKLWANLKSRRAKQVSASCAAAQVVEQLEEPGRS